MVRNMLIAAMALAIGLGFSPLANAEPPIPAALPEFKPPDFAKAPVVPVVRAVDGDTIVVQGADGQIKVRLIGVDTPETVDPRKPVQEYGKEASRFTSNLLKGERVYLVKDAQQGETDKYGRTLAYIYRYPDGLFINGELVRQGYAHAYVKYPFRYMDQFTELERFARSARKGLWGLADSSAPATQPVAQSVVPAAQPVISAPQATTPKDVMVYVTRTGAKYHAEGCRFLAKSSSPMKLEDAKKRYTPCSVCNPPQ